MSKNYLIIDGLQYSNWSEEIFKQMNDANVAAVHVTIAYHEDFHEMVQNIIVWNKFFEEFPDLIMRGLEGHDILKAHEDGRTAIFFGLQNCSPIEDDIGLVEVCYQLGVRFMQLSYNNQSLLATGCYENFDNGITRMGREVIREMNRIGMVIDMSHSSETSTIEAIKCSRRPIAITHANPSVWHVAKRNKSNYILSALAESEGMLGLSLYPHHLKYGTECTLENFCSMIATTVDLMGIERVGFGSDLCQNQPDSVVAWMRNGRWTRKIDFGEGSSKMPGFPKQPNWFANNDGFGNLASGLSDIGFSHAEIEKILGTNWLNFFNKSFGRMI